MNGIEKRKFLLREAEKQLKRVSEFERYIGQGFLRKFQRLIFAPYIYIPYLLRRVLKIKRGYIVLSNSAEIRLTKFFIKNLGENDVFYDIGANYGFYTDLALNFCKEIHSFEPHPDAYKTLEKKFGERVNVFLNNVALADTDGYTYLYLSDDNSSVSTMSEEVFKKRLFAYNGKKKVATMTLDEYVKTHSKPTYLKIDVEGAEKMVLEGGKRLFKNNNPVIAMEVWHKNKGGEISMRAVEKLRSVGYQSYAINSRCELEQIDEDLSEHTGKRGLEFENYIFKKLNNAK